MEITDQTAGIFAILVGGVTAAVFAWTLVRRRKTMNWLVTHGKIIESRLEKISNSYDRCIRYTYSVNGKNYTCDQVASVNYSYESRKHSEKLIKPYPVGKIVPVYFDPLKPSDAVLERTHFSWIDIIWAAAILAFVVIGILLIKQQ